LQEISQVSSAENSTNGNDPAGARQVLTFCLGEESYGVDIMCVREIRGWSPVTRIPHSPEHVRGVLNLRGSVVPIVDLRVRFGLENAEFTPVTVIIVLSVRATKGRREVGVVVDSVSDVIDINATDIKETPSLGSKAGGEIIQGLATVADRMLILLDVDEMIRRDLEQGEPPAMAGAA
jgi:purine-binding chemotaxis protein CheW